jgi:hypothetical protein
MCRRTRPYQQIPFQFSLHRVGEDGAIHHEAFLDLGGENPSRHLAEALIDKAGESGPVFAYNATFERMVIHQLAARFPDLAPGLVAITEPPPTPGLRREGSRGDGKGIS